MRKFLLLSCLISLSLFGQPKTEIVEHTGIVTSIRPGYRFSLEVIELKEGSETLYFKINPEVGVSILSKLEIGKSLTLKAKEVVGLKETLKNSKRKYIGIFSDQIVEIKVDDKWILVSSEDQRQVNWNPIWKVHLEKRISGLYVLDGDTKAYIFNDGVVAYNYFSGSIFKMEDSPQNIVSFVGYQYRSREEFIYPIKGVKEVYSHTPLVKIEGVITAFVIKQNFARIGLTINKTQLSFPAEYATEIERFANQKEVSVYYSGHKSEQTNALPTIHAIVQEGDTLLIEKNYYGDPDGKHEYKSTDLDGKISKINRNDKGRIISLIMGNDCYVEVDPQMATQLGPSLKKGTSIKIQGDERIKKEGEIYEQNFRIITPRRATVDGKEFILKK